MPSRRTFREVFDRLAVQPLTRNGHWSARRQSSAAERINFCLGKGRFDLRMGKRSAIRRLFVSEKCRRFLYARTAFGLAEGVAGVSDRGAQYHRIRIKSRDRKRARRLPPAPLTPAGILP